MGKAKEKPKKSSQLVLRIEKHEKDRFIAACEALDSSAGREIRRFMREFVAAQATPSDNETAPVAEPEAAVIAEAAEVAVDQPDAVEAAAPAVEKPAKKARKTTKAA